MHLVVPFAAPGSEAGRAALCSLAWPGLQALLAGRAAERDGPLPDASATDAADPSDDAALSLSPPHERALARAFGWQGGDGRWPLAAWLAAADGLAATIGARPVGLLTPAHWHLGTEQVSMTDPAALVLDEALSRALLDAVRELFTSEGFELHWGAPLRWYLVHDSLAEVATASLDRVIGRNVDRWLPDGPGARLLRRLQNEVQMLLYTHPLNDERQARGLPTINSFWLSGCGVAQPVRGDAVLDERLRRHALAEDWPGWAKAWAQIDAELPARGLTRITLCGERSALSCELPPRGLLQRLTSNFARPDLATLLETL